MCGFLKVLAAELKTYESVAIWLEGIALVAIFIWDRIDSHQQHKETLAQIDVSQRQFESSVRPVLIPHVTHHLTSTREYGVEFLITNRGQNEAVVSRVELDFYCGRSENCQHHPTEYPLLQARLLAPGETVVQSTILDPKKEIDYHEGHDGECNWIFTLAVRCSDVLNLRTHTYGFDEVLGIHHYIDPVFQKPGPIKSRVGRLANRFRNFSYRLRAWSKSKLAELRKHKRP
jgi:hypothetical protein